MMQKFWLYLFIVVRRGRIEERTQRSVLLGNEFHLCASRWSSELHHRSSASSLTGAGPFVNLHSSYCFVWKRIPTKEPEIVFFIVPMCEIVTKLWSKIFAIAEELNEVKRADEIQACKNSRKILQKWMRKDTKSLKRMRCDRSSSDSSVRLRELSSVLDVSLPSDAKTALEKKDTLLNSDVEFFFFFFKVEFYLLKTQCQATSF